MHENLLCLLVDGIRSHADLTKDGCAIYRPKSRVYTQHDCMNITALYVTTQGNSEVQVLLSKPPLFLEQKYVDFDELSFFNQSHLFEEVVKTKFQI